VRTCHRPSKARRHLGSLLACFLLMSGVMTLGAAATEGTYGFPGHTFSSAGGSPTGEKPESKLWHNDGRWWASMLSAATGKYHIHVLDRTTNSWTDTGTQLDDRPTSRADALWDGQYLYVASHVFASSSTNTVADRPARLYRYSYNQAERNYALSPGFPVPINDVSSETLTVDKDSSGRLWATWTQAQAVYVSATTTDDRTWMAPFVLPANGASGLAADDISAVASFGGKSVGVMWSNQAASAMYFATHRDGADPWTWEVSRTAVQGPNYADDHINLKALEADASGRVFAVVKTELEKVSQNAPQILALARDPVTEEWDSEVVSRASDCHTRPVLVIDREQHKLHVFATAPDSGCPFTGTAGTIFQKSSPLDDLSFPLGRGTPVIRDPASPNMNNVTTTKQSARSGTGMVILASDTVTRRYWHADLAITPAPPLAGFLASPTEGTAPLQVTFTDTSTGAPTNWAWEFGDGATSIAPSPSHTYADAGEYRARLTVSNASGSSSTEQVISVMPEPDTTGPVVVEQRPAPGATGVSVRTGVQVQFDEPVQPGSVTGATVSLAGPDGVGVDATVGYDSASRTATVTPSSALAYATGYTVTVGTGVRDLAGNALAGPVRWSFTTEPVGQLGGVGTASASQAVTTSTIRTTRTAKAGNRLVVALGYSGPATTTAAIRDSDGNLWQVDQRRDNGSKTGTTSVIASTLLSKDLPLGSTLRISFSRSVPNHAAAAFEYAGLARTAAVAGKSSNSATSATPRSGAAPAGRGCGVAFAVTVWNHGSSDFHAVDAALEMSELVEINAGTTGMAVSTQLVTAAGSHEHRGRLKSSVLWTDSIAVYQC
jgi:PKD repeat protein